MFANQMSKVREIKRHKDQTPLALQHSTKQLSGNQYGI